MNRLIALPVALAMIASAALPAWAEPSLMVSPTRLTFDGPARTAVITLLNNGTDSGTYRIFLVHYRMTESGAFEEVKEPTPEDLKVDGMVRFSPRQVTLAPRQSQTVRLQLRLPAELAAGEYRTHLLFRVLPTIPAVTANPQAKGISIRLIPAVGVSIPVIVRHGETTAKAAIGALALQPAPKGGAEKHPRLAMRLGREGNASIYGNLVATFRSRTGEEREIGRANGLAVYTPNASRQATLALSESPAHGQIKVVFRAPEPEGRILAESTLEIP